LFKQTIFACGAAAEVSTTVQNGTTRNLIVIFAGKRAARLPFPSPGPCNWLNPSAFPNASEAWEDSLFAQTNYLPTPVTSDGHRHSFSSFL
jgi:hypothetical protein